MEIDKIITEAQTEAIALKALANMRKYHDSLTSDFYDSMNEFLNDHYSNFKLKIERDLIEQITEDFIKEPKQYKFMSLRRKLIEENIETLKKTLTDDIVTQALETQLELYTHKNLYYSWQWVDAIAKFILKNWGLFEGNERINNVFLKELKNLQIENIDLKDQVKSYRETIEGTYEL